MTLSDHQWAFAQDMARFILWALQQGYKITLGEVQRTNEQQEIYFRQGKSKTRDSWHQRKLAFDFTLFIESGPTWEPEHYRPLGEFWESLSPYNRWGGNFRGFMDAGHAERRTTKRRQR